MWPSGCRAHSLRTWSLCLSCTLQLPCCCCVLCNKPLHIKDGSETQYRGDAPCSRNHSHPQVELPCGPVWYSHEVPWPSWTLQPASALELGLNPDDFRLCSWSSPSGPVWVLAPWSQLSPVDSWFLHSPHTTCNKNLLCSPIPAPNSHPRPCEPP